MVIHLHIYVHICTYTHSAYYIHTYIQYNYAHYFYSKQILVEVPATTPSVPGQPCLPLWPPSIEECSQPQWSTLLCCLLHKPKVHLNVILFSNGTDFVLPRAIPIIVTSHLHCTTITSFRFSYEFYS